MKILKLLSLCLLAVAAVSCTGDEAEKVAAKLNNGEQLTLQEYGVAIDYCGKFAEKAEGLQASIDALPDDSSTADKDAEKLADLKEKYPYLDLFNKAIQSATQDQVGKDNVKKINRYASLVWFSAPQWATISTNPDAVGLVEETPSNDSDTAVIMGATGETVVK